MGDAKESGFRQKLVDLVAGTPGAAAAAISSYFDEHYTGSQFEALVDPDPDRFTANDIVAVSTLSVDVPAAVSIWLLGDEGQAATSAQLREIPTDVDIWQEPALVSPGGHLWALWDLLSSACWPENKAGNGMGPTTISKLLAAKRPRLVPITDSVVMKVLPSDGHWAAFADALADDDARERIEAATAEAPGHLSLLRKIDIVIWMLNH